MRPLSIVAASLVLTMTLAASAQPVPSEVWTSYIDLRAQGKIYRQTRDVLVKAQAEERAGRRDEALELYSQAFDLEPFTPAVEAEYGLALLRQGKYVPGARHLQQAFRQGGPDRTLHTDEFIIDKIGEVKKEVGTIVCTLNEPDVRVYVDGEYIADWPFYQEIYVEPGEHHVKATKPGFWLDEQTVNVEKGERKHVRVAMVGRVQTHIVGMERPLNINTEGYLTGAVERPTWPTKVIMAGGGAVTIGLALLATGLVYTANAETRDEVKTWQAVSATGGIVGAIGVGAIIIGLAGRPEAPAPRVNITPSGVGKNGVGLMVGGAF